MQSKRNEDSRGKRSCHTDLLLLRERRPPTEGEVDEEQEEKEKKGPMAMGNGNASVGPNRRQGWPGGGWEAEIKKRKPSLIQKP